MGASARLLVILGAGGTAHDALDVVEAINAAGPAPAWRPIGFLDDTREPGSRHLGLEILGRLADALRFGDCTFLNVIGSDRSFRRRPEILAATGLPAGRFATLVHPAASVSARAHLGRGVLVNHGVSVGGGAAIGDHATLCPGCVVGHDAAIGEYTILAPGAIVSGHVRLGRNCYIGAGAVVRQGLEVGDRALVGMGSVVVSEVAADRTVVGNPARPLERA